MDQHGVVLLQKITVKLTARLGNQIEEFQVPWEGRLMEADARVENLKEELANLFPGVGEEVNMILYDTDKNLLVNDQTLEDAGVGPQCTLYLYLHSYPTYFSAFKGRADGFLNLQKLRAIHERLPSILFDVVCVVVGSLLIAAGAQVSFFFPWDHTVPFSFQTWAVLLVGALLGWLRGGMASLIYLCMGLAGAPFFAPGDSGKRGIPEATMGYLVGFVFAGTLTGFMSEKAFDKTWKGSILSMLAGTAVIYIFGVGWLAIVLKSMRQAILSGFVPFLIGDTIKIVLATLLLPVGWKIIAYRKRFDKTPIYDSI